jgi:PAS domain S-box-containing protein
MNKRRILIVEDEAITALNIKRNLERRGYEVIGPAVSSEQAIAMTKESNPELILMDIILQGKDDGVDTVKIINKNYSIPIIYQTAHSDEATLKRAKETKPSGYIIKPINEKELYYAVELALHKHESDKQLAINEERWKLALEASGDGVWDWDITTSNISYSEQWKKTLGYEDHEIKNSFDEWRTRIHPDDVEKTLRDLNEHLEGKSDRFYNEHQLLCKDGSYKWIIGRGKIVSYDSYGNPARVTGTLSDISLRKNAQNDVQTKHKEIEDTYKVLQSTNENLYESIREKESINEELQAAMEELKATNESLIESNIEIEKSESRYQKLFSKMIDGYAIHEIICDKNNNPIDYRFIDINPAFEKITGMTKDTIGKTIKEIMPDIEDSWIKTYGKVALTGESVIFENYSSDLKKWFKISAYSPEKNIFVTVFEDITKTKKL